MSVCSLCVLVSLRVCVCVFVPLPEVLYFQIQCLFGFCQMQNQQILGTQLDSLCHFEMSNICCLLILCITPLRIVNFQSFANVFSPDIFSLSNDNAHKFMF